MANKRNYDEFVIQWNAFAQVEQFMDALDIKGYPHMPVDHKTIIPDEGQVKDRNKHGPRRRLPRQWLIALILSDLQG
jgi:hypothetical protein